jgi:hypothetical protein
MTGVAILHSPSCYFKKSKREKHADPHAFKILINSLSRIVTIAYSTMSQLGYKTVHDSLPSNSSSLFVSCV